MKKNFLRKQMCSFTYCLLQKQGYDENKIYTEDYIYKQFRY